MFYSKDKIKITWATSHSFIIAIPGRRHAFKCKIEIIWTAQCLQTLYIHSNEFQMMIIWWWSEIECLIKTNTFVTNFRFQLLCQWQCSVVGRNEITYSLWPAALLSPPRHRYYMLTTASSRFHLCLHNNQGLGLSRQSSWSKNILLTSVLPRALAGSFCFSRFLLSYSLWWTQS